MPNMPENRLRPLVECLAQLVCEQPIFREAFGLICRDASGGREVLHFLPPYCPEGNRIEQVWWDVHANVTRNHRCKKMQALMAEVDAYLEARNVQRTASPMLRAAPARRAA
jgi:transposase